MRWLIVYVLLSTAHVTAKGCQAVPPSQCGTDSSNSCLICGTRSDFDCEKCCSGCTLVTKGAYRFCECDGPPSPLPGNDTWSHYTVAGMEVSAVAGGHNRAYEKAVIMLHGGGASSNEWVGLYRRGWLNNLTGLKLVFPTSAIASHVWFITNKAPGCRLADDCAYNVSSIRESAARVAALIEHEAGLLGGDHSKVFLAGFSEGAQLAGYVQLAQLKFALGGTIVMDGFPLPPLFNMPGHDPAAAKRNASYFGADMRWMIWHGASDYIFPQQVTIDTWNGIFDVLGARSTLKIEHIEPGMGHTVIQPELEQMVAFVRSSPASLVEDQTY